MSTDLKIGISAGVLFVGLLGGLAFYKFQQSGHTLEDLGVVAAGAVEAMFGASSTSEMPSAAPAAPAVNVTQVSAAVDSVNGTVSAARILKAPDASAPPPVPPATPVAGPAPSVQESKNKTETRPQAPKATPKAVDAAAAWTPALPLTTVTSKEPSPPTSVPSGPAPARPLVMPPPPEATARGESPAKKTEPLAPKPDTAPVPAREEKPTKDISSLPARLPESTAGPRANPVVPEKPQATAGARDPESQPPKQSPPGLTPRSDERQAGTPPKPPGTTPPSQTAISKVGEVLRLLQGSSGTGPAPVRQAQHAEGADEATIVPLPPAIDQPADAAGLQKPARKPGSPLVMPSRAPSTLNPADSVSVSAELPGKSDVAIPAPEPSIGAEGSPLVDASRTARPRGDNRGNASRVLPTGRLPNDQAANPTQTSNDSARRSASAEARTPIPSPRAFAASSKTASIHSQDELSAVPGAAIAKSERKVIAKAAPTSTAEAAKPTPAADVEQPSSVTPRRVVPPADVREELVAVGPTTSRVEKFQLVSRQELADRDPAEQVKVASYDVESYIVLAGDSFESIAAAMYGRREYGPALAHYNRATWPPGESLRLGSRVKIPPAAILELVAPKPKPAANATASSKTTVVERPANAARTATPVGPTYTVRQQETLFAIAKKTLGDGTRWGEIYRLNTDRLENEYTIPLGVVLRLPVGAKVEPTTP